MIRWLSAAEKSQRDKEAKIVHAGDLGCQLKLSALSSTALPFSFVQCLSKACLETLTSYHVSPHQRVGGLKLPAPSLRELQRQVSSPKLV